MKTWIKVLLVIGLLSFANSLVVADETANKIIADKVLTTFELDPGSYTVEFLSDGLTTTDFNESELSIKPLYTIEPLGRFTIVATVSRENKQLESRQIRLFIRKYADVAVANDRISRFNELTEKSVTMERRDVTDLREQPVVSIQSINGQRARRNLMKGTILTSGDIEPIPVIKSRSDIHLVYVSGLCRVTSKGEALQDGNIGDFIKVKNKSSGKIVIARVVDETSAAVGQ